MSEPCGLIGRATNALQTSKPDLVPLTAVRVRARLADLAARVEVTQEYENREAVPIEAVYVFPLDEQSAVCAFAVVIDGRRIEGQVLPREKAFDIYDDSIREGHGAFLLDQERPNIFTASVGSLLPGQRASIELHYLTELPREGNQIRFTLPTTVSPRYVPQAKRNFEGISDGDRVNPPVVAATPYPLELSIECDFPGGLIGVDSPTHRISTRLHGSRATVTLSGADTALDRDFVLLLEPISPPELTARTVRDEHGERYALIHLQPNLDVRREPIRVAFLLDCSGSMGGTSIFEARKALLLCLQSLEPGDQFEIVRFGSTHDALFGGLRDYDDRSLKQARAYVEATEASMGGTEILAALADVLQKAGAGTSPLRVVLLTDGQVSNEDDVLALAQENRQQARVFAFGIGAGASDHLVRGVARVSGGAAEFIAPGESIEQKVTRQFSRVVGGCLDRIELHWDGLSASDVTPREWPALARGDRLSLIARIGDGSSGRLQVSAHRGEERTHIEVVIPPLPADAAADAVIPTLWARRRIRELETSGPSGGSRQQRKRSTDHTPEAERQKELEVLGARFGLVSSATSYVAVETREPGLAGSTQPELRRIPTALTRGWGRDLKGPGSVHFDGHLAMRAKAAAGLLSNREGTPSRQLGIDEQIEIAMFTFMCAEPISCGGDANAAHGADPDFSILVGQCADGGWDLDRELADWCGAKLSRLRQAAREIPSPEGERILATWIVIARLTNRVGGTPESWSGPLAKARRWLEGATQTVVVPRGAHSWEAWVQAILDRSS